MRAVRPKISGIKYALVLLLFAFHQGTQLTTAAACIDTREQRELLADSESYILYLSVQQQALNTRYSSTLK